MTSPRHPEEGPGDAEVDRAFREIVAGLRRPEAPHDPTDPEGKGGTERTGHYLNPPPQSHLDHPPARQPGHLGPGTPEGMATDHRSYEPPEEDDHFVPPDPPPLPAGDLHFWAIVAGLTVGPLLIVLSAVIPVLDRPWAIAGLLLSGAGFVLLVLRQPRHRGPDDGTHGAQV